MGKIIQAVEKLISRPDENLGLLENRLQKVLDPVAPNPDFVTNLKYQLLSQWGTIPALPTSNTPILVLIVVTLMVSGIMFIVVSVRLIFILGSIISLLGRRRTHSPGESLQSARMVT